jgi:hypothetical protein
MLVPNLRVGWGPRGPPLRSALSLSWFAMVYFFPHVSTKNKYNQASTTAILYLYEKSRNS